MRRRRDWKRGLRAHASPTDNQRARKSLEYYDTLIRPKCLEDQESEPARHIADPKTPNRPPPNQRLLERHPARPFHHARRQLDTGALITMFTEDGQRSRSHGLRPEILQRQASVQLTTIHLGQC